MQHNAIQCNTMQYKHIRDTRRASRLAGRLRRAHRAPPGGDKLNSTTTTTTTNNNNIIIDNHDNTDTT